MSEGEKTKTITEELRERASEIAEEICDSYCKWPLLYGDGEEEKLFSERCDKCPLMQL